MRLSVQLAGEAHEMAQEEIQKQVGYLSPEIRNVRFTARGTVLESDVPDAHADRLERDVRVLADRMQRSLRRLERKVVFRSAMADRVIPHGSRDLDGLHVLGRGQVALTGLPLTLFMYFDRIFTELGDRWHAQPVRTPTLIPSQVLARCDYFRSFPQNVTFASHLREDLDVIDGFRTRHGDRDDLDDRALGDMASPEACLSPAVCYHIYHLHQDRTIPAAGTAHAAKTRYRQAGTACTLSRIDDGQIKVDFREPQRAVTPGQSVVLYDAEVCLGGAVIA